MTRYTKARKIELYNAIKSDDVNYGRAIIDAHQISEAELTEWRKLAESKTISNKTQATKRIK